MGQIKILTIGDLHYKRDNVEESLRLNEFILAQIDLIKPNLVVILGDVLHNHDSTRTQLVCLAIKFFQAISKKCPLWVLIGNHDRVNNSDYLSDLHPFYGLDLPNVKIAAQVKTDVMSGVRMIFVPYVYPGRFKEALNTLSFDFKEADLIFAHQEIRGVKVGLNRSRVGDVWEEDLPLVISGHIHQYQRVAKNVLYVGTPRMTDFGDSMDKTISLFTVIKEEKEGEELETETKEEIEEKLETKDKELVWTEERIEVPLAKKTTLEITFEEINVQSWDFPPARIIIRCNEAQRESIRSHPTVSYWIKNGIKIKPVLISPIKPAIKSSPMSHSFTTIVESKLVGTPLLDVFRQIINNPSL